MFGALGAVPGRRGGAIVMELAFFGVFILGVVLGIGVGYSVRATSEEWERLGSGR